MPRNTDSNQKPRASRSTRKTVKDTDLKKVQLKPSQHDYHNTILKNEITFCSGPAGTSKTFTACYAALHLLATKQIKSVILCKPIQESGEKLGFLPGDIADKIDPFMQSYISNFKKIIGHELTEALISTGVLEFKPLAYMRGDTFDDSLMILDEAQNATFKQLMLFVTRMGKKSKVIVTGDISQYDIPKNNIGLPGFISLMDGVRGIGHHKFTDQDIVRAKILRDVVAKYDRWRVDNDPQK